MDPRIVGILIVVVIIALYFITYLVNANTEVPEGTRVIDKCSVCNSGSCSLSKKTKVKEHPEEECDLFEEIREELRK